MPVEPVLLADEAEVLITAAAEGAGIAIATDWLLRVQPAARGLVPVLPGWESSNAGSIYLVTPPGRLVPAKTRAFVELALARLGSDAQAGKLAER